MLYLSTNLTNKADIWEFQRPDSRSYFSVASEFRKAKRSDIITP